MRLENAHFTAIVGTGVLTAGQFVSNTTGVATDADDRMIYETDTGNIYYDINGNGAGGRVHIAVLDANLGITAADFFVV